MRKPNDYILRADGNIEIILVSRSLEEKGRILINPIDLDLLLARRWSLSGNGYAVTTKYIDKKYVFTYVHHLLLPKKPGFVVDHINQNPLDNRRENLRYLSHADNLINSRRMETSGVSYMKREKKWRARVGGRKIRYQAWFSTESQARKARNLFLGDIRTGAKEMNVA